MHSSTIVISIIVLIAIVAKHSSVATHDSYIQALRRRTHAYNYDKNQQRNMFLRRLAQQLIEDKDSDENLRYAAWKRDASASVVWSQFEGKGGLNVAPCPKISSVEGQSVAGCQNQCQSTSGCNAIDLNAGGHCTFRGCNAQIPPLDSDTSYNSYIMENSTARNYLGKGGLNTPSCSVINSAEGQSVAGCANQCQLTSGCNAFDINAGGHCTFRTCNTTNPSPVSDTTYNAYIMEATPARRTAVVSSRALQHDVFLAVLRRIVDARDDSEDDDRRR